MIDEYLDYIHEGYIISNKTIMIDFDKFIKGGRLFIIGFSGSGKTGIAKAIEKKFRVKVCNLDSAWDRFGEPNVPTKAGDEWNDLQDDANKHMFEMIKDKRGCRVTEGIQLIFPPLISHIKPMLMKEACIIMGKSALKSVVDATLRNKRKWDKPYIPSIRGALKVNTKLYKRIENFRKERRRVSKTIKRFEI